MKFKVEISKIPDNGCQASCKKCKKPFFIAKPPTSAGKPTSTSPKKASPKPKAQSPKKAIPAGRRSKKKPASAKKAVPHKTARANQAPAKKANQVKSAPTGRRKNFLLVPSLAVLIMLICAGAVYFLMHKYDFQVTAKTDDATPAIEAAPEADEPIGTDQTAVVTSTDTDLAADTMDGKIGRLFNKVNPAVATVLTYDSGNNLFKQGSGFFISQDGDFITNYHVLKGAYAAVVKFHNDVEYKVEFVLAENEKKI